MTASQEKHSLTAAPLSMPNPQSRRRPWGTCMASLWSFLIGPGGPGVHVLRQ